MALLLKNGSIFLHIPKTGGNWVRHILKKSNLIHSEIGHKHADMTRTIYTSFCSKPSSLIDSIRRKPILPKFPDNSVFLFTFVRHPISWYESWFRYQSQATKNWYKFGTEGILSDWHPNSTLNGLGHPEFSIFIDRVLKKRPGYVTELFFSYTTPEISFIGKQENLRKDLCKALSLANEKYDEDMIMNEKPVGISNPPSLNMAWGKSQKTEALRLEWPSIVRFGYVKQSGAIALSDDR
jgi:hypothetical protein